MIPLMIELSSCTLSPSYMKFEVLLLITLFDLSQRKHLYNAGSSKSKKRKLLEMKKNVIEESIRLPNPMIGYGVPSMPSERAIRRSLPEEARGRPYFYYENVALTPKGVWDTISRFLYDIDPEFVDSKFFSACARKRGYIHNLPIENRFPLVPLPPLTIQQAFPLSKRWWPKWDPRDKLNCIQTAIASAKLTERIRTALERYEGDPPEAVQRYVLEQCRKWNLVWVGRNKLAPLECDEVEMLLGFPKNHTRGGGISRTDRYKSLGNSFQVSRHLLLSGFFLFKHSRLLILINCFCFKHRLTQWPIICPC